jgi:hypothetical protein
MGREAVIQPDEYFSHSVARTISVDDLRKSGMAETSSDITTPALRMRQKKAMYGKNLNLKSHGFTQFNIREVDRFFDPLRLQLLLSPLSEIRNETSR